MGFTQRGEDISEHRNTWRDLWEMKLERETGEGGFSKITLVTAGERACTRIICFLCALSHLTNCFNFIVLLQKNVNWCPFSKRWGFAGIIDDKPISLP